MNIRHSHYLGQKNKLHRQICIVFILVFTALLELSSFTTALQFHGQKALEPLIATQLRFFHWLRQPYLAVELSFSKVTYLKELEKAHSEALTKLTELETVALENTELRKLLETSERNTQRVVLAAPINSLAFPAIGVGSEQGISTGDLVLYNEALIGVVGAVSPYQARVELLTDFRKKYLLVRTESGVEGLITGNGKQVLLTQVGNEQPLSVGERVFTVGQDGVPRDIIIGTIRSIQNTPTAPTQTAIIQQYGSFYEAVVVEVL